MLPDIQTLQALVVDTAQRELLPRFRAVEHHHKADGSVVTEADLAMQQALIDGLRQGWPDIPLLGEEMSAEERERLLSEAQEGLWVLDPLDGTSNYAQGIPCFAVSLALLREGRPQLAVVYDPTRDELFTAVQGEGAQLNGEPLIVQERYQGGTIAYIDFKRLPPELSQRLIGTDVPHTSQRNFGSSVLDWCQIAAGRGAYYVHGRQQLWDYAAGSLILAEAGGYATTLNGGEVITAQLAPSSVVAAPTQALFKQWCDWLAVPL